MQGRIRKKISLGMMTVICAAVLSSCGTNTVKSDVRVMEINNQSVLKEEYQMIAKSHVAEVTMQYTTDEANQKDFWTTEFTDGKPVDKLISLTKKELTEKKVIAQLAKDAGIDTESDYLSIQSRMQTHNEENIYGLTNMEISDYYDYIYTDLKAGLIEYLKAENPVTEEELRRIYEENKADYTNEVCVDMLVAEMPSETDAALFEEISETMAEETDIEALTALYPETDFYTITLSSLDTQEGKTGVYTERWQKASVMEQDTICEPFYADNHILIMRCLKRSEDFTWPFEEVRGILESEVLTANAKAIIQAEIEKAEIIEDVDLEEITIEALQ